MDLSSDDFTQGSSLPEVEVSSGVTAEQAVTDAQTDLTAIKSAKAGQCIAPYFKEAASQGAGSGVTIGDVAINPVATTAPATDGSFGETLTATMTDQGVAVNIAIVFEGFVDKNYEVEVSSLGIGEVPSSSTDQRLLGLLANRAVAAIH